MLEKAEPMEWYMNCTLHMLKKRRLSWCSNTASGQQVEPIITVEGVSMPTYEYHCQACDRTFTIHQSLEERDSTPVECPHCQEENVEQVLTSFVAVTSKKS